MQRHQLATNQYNDEGRVGAQSVIQMAFDIDRHSTNAALAAFSSNATKDWKWGGIIRCRGVNRQWWNLYMI